MKTSERARTGPPRAEAIVARRKALDVTLATIVERVKGYGYPFCSTTTLSAWEHGLVVPERAWTPLAKALRCSVASLRR